MQSNLFILLMLDYTKNLEVKCTPLFSDHLLTIFQVENYQLKNGWYLVVDGLNIFFLSSFLK